jgi:hypothetical protein
MVLRGLLRFVAANETARSCAQEAMVAHVMACDAAD